MCPSFPELSCDGNLQPIQIWRLSRSICVDLTTSCLPTSGPILIVVSIYVATARSLNFSIHELGDFENIVITAQPGTTCCIQCPAQ